MVRGDSGGLHDHTSQRATDQSPAEPEACGRSIGPFENSLHLLQSGILTRRGIRSVGVCGHPEGIGSDIGVDEVGWAAPRFPLFASPSVAIVAISPLSHCSRSLLYRLFRISHMWQQLSLPSTLCQALGYLCEKLDYAAGSGLESRVVTQVCFDVNRATALVDALRRSGHASPVSIGLVGPTKHAVLERMAVQCGVGRPPALPSHDSASDEQAAEAEESIPSDSLRSLASWRSTRGAAAGVLGIHLYPFGGMKPTYGWLRRVGGSPELRGLCLDAASSFHRDGDA